MFYSNSIEWTNSSKLLIVSETTIIIRIVYALSIDKTGNDNGAREWCWATFIKPTRDTCFNSWQLRTSFMKIVKLTRKSRHFPLKRPSAPSNKFAYNSKVVHHLNSNIIVVAGPWMAFMNGHTGCFIYANANKSHSRLAKHQVWGEFGL